MTLYQTKIMGNIMYLNLKYSRRMQGTHNCLLSIKYIFERTTCVYTIGQFLILYMRINASIDQ